MELTIIIPVYNRPELLEFTIQSILHQSYKDWKCLLVDDGSDDDTIMLLHKLCALDSRLTVIFRNRKPKGASTCRNIGLNYVNSNYVLFMDSDDIMSESCLENRFTEIYKKPDFDFYVFNSELFLNTPGDMRVVWNTDTDESDLYRYLRLDGVWQTSGAIYSTDFIKSISGFKEGLGIWQDYELHIRAILANGKYIKFLQLPANIFIRVSETESISRTKSKNKQIENLRERAEVYLSLFTRIEKSNFKQDQQWKEIYGSICFWFGCQFYLKYGDITYTKHFFKKLKGLLGYSRLTRSKYSFFCYLLKFSNRFKGIHHLIRFLIRMRCLPDYYIQEGNTMCKVKL
ncbi:hypothetical protein GCM10007049_00620 [Echinicola pacifica]|uniref:Glycosyltransferase 2-like domain-containing protein n=1 Tax=Echinicola pacifica TaxID=346377 RepID=A0A918UHP4_9BACT|nr:glycosyltransferase family 2 protein [Echinicola pacifica]GGZ12800.1 hypothetical protein GCM10007049_00620 [Echinicola pacifica]